MTLLGTAFPIPSGGRSRPPVRAFPSPGDHPPGIPAADGCGLADAWLVWERRRAGMNARDRAGRRQRSLCRSGRGLPPPAAVPGPQVAAEVTGSAGRPRRGNMAPAASLGSAEGNAAAGGRPGGTPGARPGPAGPGWERRCAGGAAGGGSPDRGRRGGGSPGSPLPPSPPPLGRASAAAPLLGPQARPAASGFMLRASSLSAGSTGRAAAPAPLPPAGRCSRPRASRFNPSSVRPPRESLAGPGAAAEGSQPRSSSGQLPRCGPVCARRWASESRSAHGAGRSVRNSGCK